MPFELKPNTWSLFRNDRKEKDTHPDHKGQANIDGVEYWMDGWINETQDGKRYFRGNLKPKQPKPAAPKPPEQQSLGADQFDDDIPF